MFDADTQLLQPCQIVEHAPLLDNAVSSDPVNRHFLYLDAPPRRLDAPERTLVRSAGNVAAPGPVAGAEHIDHLLMPVGERGSDPFDAETNTLDAAPLRHLGTWRPVCEKIMCIDAIDEREVARVPNLVERVHK